MPSKRANQDKIVPEISFFLLPLMRQLIDYDLGAPIKCNQAHFNPFS